MLTMREEFGIEEEPERKRQTFESDESESDGNASESNEVESNHSSMCSDFSDTNFMPESVQKRQKKAKNITGVMALDDAGLSDYKTTSVVLSVANMLGIDIETLSVSRTTLNRKRTRIRNEITRQK